MEKQYYKQYIYIYNQQHIYTIHIQYCIDHVYNTQHYIEQIIHTVVVRVLTR